VWSIDPTREKLIKKVQHSAATLSMLTNNDTRQHGTESDNYDLAGCSDTGAGCTNVYAVSIPGVTPSRFITWFQATAACRNAGKRLLTNAEWQTAALGTPDPGTAGDGVTTCNTRVAQAAATGSGSTCRSDAGVFDMVGNVWEWVADWMQGDSTPWSPSTGTTGAVYGDDLMLGTNPAQAQGGAQNLPAALERGGSFKFGNLTQAGVFALSASQAPSASFEDLGFRCGR
jgi:formylglycine-generating enzyme required for sulfatase activity